MNLAEFAKWVIAEGPWEGCDLDGGSIQDRAVKDGILVETTYSREKHGPTDIAVDGDPWFIFSAEFEAALKRGQR